MFAQATGKRPWRSLTRLSATLGEDFAALVLSVVHGFLGEEDEATTI
jgi:hypothetical protein